MNTLKLQKCTAVHEAKVTYKQPDYRVKVTSAREVYDILNADIVDHDTLELCETFYALSFNRATEIKTYRKISVGSDIACVVDLKLIMLFAVKTRAASIIVAHNHPSGNLQASTPDIDITKRIKDALNLVDIKLLDHLILTKKGYFSFAEEGRL